MLELGLGIGFSFGDSVRCKTFFGSSGISFVPFVLGLSKLDGLLSGSGTYLPFILYLVCSDKPTVSSALSIGADQKKLSHPPALS